MVGPIQIGKLDKEETKNRLYQSKLSKLSLAEKLLDASSESTPDQKGSSFMQSWTAKILDTLEFEIKHLHIRYEDNNAAFLNRSFSAGLTIESFSIQTQSGKQTKPSSKPSLIRKAAQLKRIGIYWNTTCQPLSHLSFEEWKLQMKAMIFGERWPGAPQMEYVLSPVTPAPPKTSSSLSDLGDSTHSHPTQDKITSLTLRLVHSEGGGSVPMFDVSLDSPCLPLSLDAIQYQQLASTLDLLGATEQRRQPYSYRPLIRPGRGLGAQLWWRYAIRLVIRKPRYIKLVKMLKDKTYKMSPRIAAQMREFEEKTPLRALILFRHEAVQEIQRDSKAKTQPLSSTQPTYLDSLPSSNLNPSIKPSRGWGQWGWSLLHSVSDMGLNEDSDSDDEESLSETRNTTQTDDDDVPISTIIAQLEGGISSASSQSNPESTLEEKVWLQFNLNSTITFLISKNHFPIARSTLSLVVSSSITSTHSNGKIDVTSLDLEDLCSPPSYPIRHLISVKPQSSLSLTNPLTSLFSVSFESQHGKTSLKVSSLPVEIALNKQCIQHLLSAFSSPPKIAVKAGSRAINAVKEKVQELRRLPSLSSTYDSDEETDSANTIPSTEEAKLEICFEAHSPTFIIPEDKSTNSSGYLLLNTGYFQLNGSVRPSGILLDVSIKDIYAGLPISHTELYNFSQNGMHLIKPFDIAVTLQNYDQRKADLTLQVNILPELRGEVDPSKLTRLLSIIDVITSSFKEKILNDPFVSLLEEYSQDRRILPSPSTKPSSPSSSRSTADLSHISDELEDNIPDLLLTIGLDVPHPASSELSVDVDPFHLNTSILVSIPRVVLDLTLTTDLNSTHLVLSLCEFQTKVKSRPYDTRILIDLHAMSIEDTARSESQRYLISTPDSDQRLIQIIYSTMSDTRSPLYTSYGSTIDVKFSSLNMSLDLVGVARMKPFISVLFAKKSNPSTAIPQLDASISTPILPTSPPPINSSPQGLALSLNWQRLSLDLLRPVSHTQPRNIPTNSNQILASAFSLQLTGLRVYLDLKGLLNADIKLKSFDIFDIRDLSKDYVFKKVFCPIFQTRRPDDQCTKLDSPSLRTSISSQTLMQLSFNGQESSESPSNRDSQDLLHVTYRLDDPDTVYTEVEVIDTASFVALDTILDLVDIAVANFNGILDLLSNPDSDSSAISSEEIESLKTLNCVARIRNSKLVVLDDPTVPESRAIVGHSGIELHYSKHIRNTKGGSTVFLKHQQESIHLSMKNLELFVLRSMCEDRSHPILEPIDIEFHYKRNLQNNSTTLTDISIVMDSLNARVSVFDLSLAQSIFTRRLLSDNQKMTSEEEEESLQLFSSSTSSHELRLIVDDEEEDEEDLIFRTCPGEPADETPLAAVPPEPSIPEPLPSIFNLSFNIHSFQIVAINDFNGQNIPVLRAQTQDLSAELRGSIQSELIGECSSVCSADFYNSRLSLWEPVLDRWRPAISISLKPALHQATYILKSEQTLQLTVSGAMLNKLLHTYSLILMLDDTAPPRETLPEIVLNNCLGPELPLDIFDSATGLHLVHLEGGQVGVEMPKLVETPPRFAGASFHSNRVFRPSAIHRQLKSRYPAAVDLHFLGKFDSLRHPLFHLPLKVNRPKPYVLQCTPLTSTHESDSDLSCSSSSQQHQALMEPIEEESFENARYDPLSGLWRAPYFPRDPPEWTDSSCSTSRPLSEISFSPEEWEWRGKWKIDMHGVIGEEIDSEGWEYSTTFKSFSISSQRRAFQPMDLVRRRRWTRVRVPKSLAALEDARPLTLFWDIKVLQNGTKEIDIRSEIQLKNNLPFSLEVLVKNSSWAEDINLPPIGSGQLLNLPILLSNATSIVLKPENANSCDWSQDFELGIQPHDYQLFKELSCYPLRHAESVAKKSTTTTKTTTTANSSSHSFCFCALATQTNKSLLVEFLPFISIKNRLPCDIKFRCTSSHRPSPASLSSIPTAIHSSRQEGSLQCGATQHLSQIPLSSHPIISFRAEPFDWSQPIPVLPDLSSDKDPNSTAFPRVSNVEFLHPDGRLGLILMMKVEAVRGCCVDVLVFSKSVLIDRSSLGISIWNTHKLSLPDHTVELEVIRNTFSGLQPSPKSRSKDSNLGQQHHPSSTLNSDAPNDGEIAHVYRREVPTDARHLKFIQSRALVPATLILSEEYPDYSSTSTSESITIRSHFLLQSNSSPPPPSNPPQTLPSSGTSALKSQQISRLGDTSLPLLGYDLNSQQQPLTKSESLPSFESTDSTDPILSDLFVSSLQFGSSQPYSVSEMKVGSRVYTDRSLVWTHFPPFLKGSLSIQSACADRCNRSKNIIVLSPTRPSLLLLFIDKRILKPPSWVAESGFERAVEVAVAKFEKPTKLPLAKIECAETREYLFSIYGKCVGPRDSISLHGNWSRHFGYMYTVCLFQIPNQYLLGPQPSTQLDFSLFDGVSVSSLVTNNLPPYQQLSSLNDFPKLFSQLTLSHSYNRRIGSNCWVKGGLGLTMFHSDSDFVSLGVNNGKAWTDEICLDPIKSANSSPFEVVDWENSRSYQLVYSLSSMPGVFSSTQVVTILPRYCIVNCTDQAIGFVQLGTTEVLWVPCFETINWHKSNVAFGSLVQLRSQCTRWSMAVVDINEMGTSCILLPRIDPPNRRENDKLYREPFVLNVEVRMAGVDDECGVLVVVSQASVSRRNCSLSVRNESDFLITATQLTARFELHGVSRELFDVEVPPLSWMALGWADPDSTPDLEVTASILGPATGESPRSDYSSRNLLVKSLKKKRSATISFLKPGQLLRLPESSGRGEVLLSVEREGEGKVLRVRNMDEAMWSRTTRHFSLPLNSPFLHSTPTTALTTQESSSSPPSLTMQHSIKLSLCSVGLSVVAERPRRRELLSLYLDQIDAHCELHPRTNSPSGSSRLSPSSSPSHSHTSLSTAVFSFDFSLRDIQIDSYSTSISSSSSSTLNSLPCSLFPVPFHSLKREIHATVTGVDDTQDDEDEEEGDPLSDEDALGEGGFFSENISRKSSQSRKSQSIHRDSGLHQSEREEMNSKGINDASQNELSVLCWSLRIGATTPSSIPSTSPDLCVDYFALRILPLSLELDSSFLSNLFLDLISDLHAVSGVDQLASNRPEKWIDQHTISLLHPSAQLERVDLQSVLTSTRSRKIYFREVLVHPIKITLTFVQTPYLNAEVEKIQRRGEDGWDQGRLGRGMGIGMRTGMRSRINQANSVEESHFFHSEASLRSTASILRILSSLPGVDAMKLRLKSFQVEDAFESRSSLVTRLHQKTLQDLQSQLISIVGSLAAIGSPMGFVRKVGSGVKAFFYEPMQGAVKSPHAFFEGIGKGTSSLVGGVVMGAMNSTASFVGSASKGMSFLSGDKEYVKKRAIKRHANRATRGGLVDSIRDGGESVVSGFTSGMSGLLTKPLEEVKKGGAIGFFKGVGLGLIGAAIKPMMGIADGVASVAGGISNSVSDTVIYRHARPARALSRSQVDESDLVIEPLNLEAAFAQDFILSRARANHYDDSFLQYVSMDSSSSEALLLSEVYLFWRKDHTLWGRTWANISHCLFDESSVVIFLYFNSSTGLPECHRIPCGSRAKSLKVYAALAQNAKRMGNPALIIPADLVEQGLDMLLLMDPEKSESLISRLSIRGSVPEARIRAALRNRYRILSPGGELSGYRFGSINSLKLKPITGPESDVLKRGTHFLEQGYSSLEELDMRVLRLLWEWDCTHPGMTAARCCSITLLNRTLRPIQISRIHLIKGKNVLIIGSKETGYEAEARCLNPQGSIVIFLWAYSPSPIEVGHLKVVIFSAVFTAHIASIQRESYCESTHDLTAAFLEKTVHEWWSKYCIVLI